MDKKWTAVLLVSMLLMACGKTNDSAKPAQAADIPVVRIATAAPLSGAIAHLGKDNELGVKMAIDDLNASGLVIGQTRVRLEMLSEDDAGDPKQGTAIAQKFVDMKVNGVVGHFNSGVTIPASKIYSAAGIPEISPSSTNPKYTRQGFKTAFRLVADDIQLGGAMARFAVNTLKARRIAIIDDRSAYGQGVADEFEKAAKAANASIVGREFTTDKSTDFNAILTKLKAAHADVIFFGGQDAVGGPMLRQMKALGINLKFLGGDGLCTGEMAKLSGDALGDDVVYCAEAGGVEGEFEKKMLEWKAEFRRRYGVDVQLYAANAYDAVNVLVAAMMKAGSADPAIYLPQVSKVQIKGLTGPIAFDEKGDILQGALTLSTFRGGKKEPIGIVR